MAKRIKFSPDGVYVSRPGFDVDTASIDNLCMYPGMKTMYPSYTNIVTLNSGQSADFSIPNPSQRIPFVILMATSGEQPARDTYCAEIWPPYNTVRIHNISGPTRTIRFAALIDNT
ncbi:hypothetical protein [Brucella sp. BO2]|uniref:hypothetical protein n=1 Tax=Brucella sp. BO2 TaxID=693750 RepID=UPI0009FBD7DB|nr:hypothetical protein [Brucella sp. BO2]